MFYLVRQFGAFNECFTGHAAIVQAVAAHFVGFYQSHLCLDHRCNVGRHQPTRTAANDHHIAIKRLGFDRAPARIHLTLFHHVHGFAGHQRKQAQQYKRPQ